MNKKFNARIILKHEVEKDWQKAIDFIPLKGEIIVYDTDAIHLQPRLKIGDGITTVNSLPFFGEKE